MDRYGVFLLGIFLIFPRWAHAHKVIVFAWVENGIVYTESSFSSKKKAKGCVITVKDGSGKIVHQGRTDTLGNYQFKAPDPPVSDLVVYLDAGTGHQASWKISKKDLALNAGPADASALQAQRDELMARPSPYKVLSGIAVIFLAAALVRMIKGRKND